MRGKLLLILALIATGCLADTVVMRSTFHRRSNVPVEYTTNVVVTGTIDPDATGTYTYQGLDSGGYPYWKTDTDHYGNYWYLVSSVHVGQPWFICENPDGMPFGPMWWLYSLNPVGDYDPFQNTTGIAHVEYLLIPK
jgi:hypothetical protein